VRTNKMSMQLALEIYEKAIIERHGRVGRGECLILNVI